MATKVFISWGGELSRKLGEALRLWLPSALQFVKPYFTPEDVQKGTKWDTEIAKELQDSQIGIICLTRDNTERPWILFEAGALSKSIEKSRVCTLLFNLDPTDIKGPLMKFQGTRFLRDDFKKLVVTINDSAGDTKLQESVLDGVFDKWWPDLESQVKKILGEHDPDGKKEQRSDRDIFEEILELTRMTASQIQYYGSMGFTVLPPTQSYISDWCSKVPTGTAYLAYPTHDRPSFHYPENVEMASRFRGIDELKRSNDKAEPEDKGA